MQITDKLGALVSMMVLLATASLAQEPANQSHKNRVAPQAASGSVTGSGTTGQITKWTGVSGANTFTVGDSNIFEDKFGKIGIGTHTPTSPLTVQGMIETTLGGYKFPDGTVQTTAFNPNQVVRSLNGLTGNVTLAAGANITITPSGNTLTIAAANALTGVAHDTTLQGNGTAGSPLGVAVPLHLSHQGPGDGSGIIEGEVTSGFGAGVFGSSPSIGVHGRHGGAAFVFGAAGVMGESNDGQPGVFGSSNSGDGLLGRSLNGDGVHGISGTGNFGVNGESSSSTGAGVRGIGRVGVKGLGIDNTSIAGGDGMTAIGGSSTSDSGGFGVTATGGAGSGAGKFGGDGIVVIRGSGSNGAANGRAGSFVGDVDIQGKLTKTMGTFKIDHPLDPENKYLYHSFVESPDMMNIYNGNITTDQNGEAVVEMPDYFDALNKDFRYQLTVIGQFAQAIIASKMKGNRFVIKTNAPNVEVSWMVTGIRHDAYAEKNRVKVEEDKAERERGTYLHPEVFNQPEEKSVEWARHPEMMQRLKQQQAESAEKIKRQRQ